MLIVVNSHCDAQLEGGRKALFPGQRYDLPEDAVRPLILSGHVRVFGQGAPAMVRAVSRPRAEKKPKLK